MAASANSGRSASAGMTAMSWNSRMLNAERPYWELSCLRSASSCSTRAVEDIDKPKPMISAERQLCPPIEYAMAAIPAVVIASCADPRPKMGLRSTHSREGWSSSPMTNISSTMPNSARCRVASTRLIKPRQAGPMMMPAAR